LEGTTPAELEYIELEEKIVDLRGRMADAESDYNNALNTYNTLVDKMINHEKYKAEAMRDVWELQDKLYAIELKRYKLAQERDDLDQELFDSLAEDGLLTQEIIDEYVEWQEAEGEVMKLHDDYAGVVANLTEEEQKWVEQLMNADRASEDGAIAYQEALDALSGVAGLSTIIAMNDALDYAAQQQLEFSNIAQDIAGHYVDAGIASANTAEAIYGIRDATNDADQVAYEYNEAVANLADAWEVVYNLIW